MDGNNITRDELYNYYIVQNNTRVATATHFNIKKCGLEKLLNLYGIKKGKFETFDDLKKRVTKEELTQYYIVENHSWDDTMKHFQLHATSIDKLLREYGLNKIKNKQSFVSLLEEVDTEELSNYYATHSYSETAKFFNITEDKLYKLVKYLGIQKPKGEKVTDIAKRISKEDFIQYYIEQDHSQKEVQEFFSISESQLIGLIRYYGVFKKDKIEDSVKKISKEELYQYYIVENKGPYQLAKELNMSIDMMYGIIRYYDLSGMRMDAPTRMKNKVSKDELNEYYVVQSHSVQETMENFGLTHWELCQLLRIYEIRGRGGTSIYEEMLINSLPKGIQIIKNDRKALGNGKEIDIYLPEYKVGIEFNGDYWHSSLKKERKYHFDKSVVAEENGIRLIHVYEYEWIDQKKKDKILSIINAAVKNIDIKFYARNCEIKEITNKEAKLFNENNHLQGHRNAQITYGLFYKGELVQLMSFSKAKYNKNLQGSNDWEIIRSCQKLNTIVVGGVQKLFKHFVGENTPSSVFSYCDFNKFDGNSYESLGMNFVGYTGPDLWWVLEFAPDVVVPRNPSKHSELKEMAVAQIWGAGSKKFLWSKDNTQNT